MSYRAKCPKCGKEDVYHGFFSVECWNIACPNWTNRASEERAEYLARLRGETEEKSRSKSREEDDTQKLYPHTPVNPSKFKSSDPDKTPTYPWGKTSQTFPSGNDVYTSSSTKPGKSASSQDEYDSDDCFGFYGITDDEIDTLMDALDG